MKFLTIFWSSARSSKLMAFYSPNFPLWLPNTMQLGAGLYAGHRQGIKKKQIIRGLHEPFKGWYMWSVLINNTKSLWAIAPLLCLSVLMTFIDLTGPTTMFYCFIPLCFPSLYNSPSPRFTFVHNLYTGSTSSSSASDAWPFNFNSCHLCCLLCVVSVNRLSLYSSHAPCKDLLSSPLPLLLSFFYLCLCCLLCHQWKYFQQYPRLALMAIHFLCLPVRTLPSVACSSSPFDINGKGVAHFLVCF